MRRTLRVHTFPVHGVRPGCVRVAQGYDDPGRGAVDCPAAPLLAAALGAMEQPTVAVECGPVTQCADGDGLLLAASYVDRAGRVAGIGFAAHRDDPAALSVAEVALSRWTAVMRSRRLLIARATLCAGGRRAQKMIEGLSKTHGPEEVFVVGRPAEGPPGVTVVEEVGQVPDGGLVVFPAHGARSADRAEAAARGLRVVDATCPLVAATQADAAAYARRGDMVVVVGKTEHAVTPVLAAEAAGKAMLVESANAAGELARLRARPGQDRVAFVVDPAMPVEDALAVVAAARSHIPGLAGHHFDVLCEHASDQAAALGSVMASSDLTLVLTGGQDQPAEVAEVVRGASPGVGGQIVPVSRVADLSPEQLAEVTTVGILTGGFTPRGLQDQIVRVLSGLGPVAVGCRVVQTAAEHAPLAWP